MGKHALPDSAEYPQNHSRKKSKRSSSLKKTKKHHKSHKSLMDSSSADPDYTMTASQATSIEHSVSQLQQAVRSLIEKAPNMAQLESHIKNLGDRLVQETTEDPELASQLLVLSRNQKIQLAAYLKTLYEAKKLKLFKQIANFNEHTELKDYEPIKLSLKHEKRVAESEESDGTERNGTGSSDNEPAKAFRFIEMTGPNGEKLVPLPVIEDPSLEAQVFTHRSVVNNLNYLSKDDKLHSHNERLEFLGDSVLNEAVTEIIFQRFKNADEGELSVMRSRLINNKLLMKLGILYGFDKRLRKDEAFNEQDGKGKYIADIVEAYIGALYVCGNFQNGKAIKQWLGQLLEPTIQEVQDLGKTNLNRDAKGQLYALIGSAMCHPEYVNIKEGDGVGVPYIVACKMGDEVIATGEDQSAKNAGLRAAMKALNNKEIIEKFHTLRLKTPRSESVRSDGNGSSGNGSSSNGNASNGDTAMETDDDDDDQSWMNITLPVEVPASVEVDSTNGKTKLYAYLGERKSLPEYKKEGDKTTLTINSVPVCYAIDASSKKAAHRCAKYVMENPNLLKRCYVFD